MSSASTNKVNRTAVVERPAGRKSGRGPLKSVLASGMAVLASSAAWAEGPAVSEVNGKFSVEGGGVGSNSHGGSGLGVAEGSFTVPLGYSFGLQLDGGTATAYNNFYGGGGAQLFWRDPQHGLFGGFASAAGGNGATLSWYGAQAEYFAGPVTLGGYGGYQMAYNAPVSNGGLFIGRLTYYPIPDLALTAGGGVVASNGFGRLRLEYQPELNGRHSMSFFVNGGAGADASYSVTGGIRFHFGPEKTLIRRHREDDPASVLMFGSGGDGGAGGFVFGNGGAGGAGGLVGGGWGGSDIRLKRDIVLIGRRGDGLGIYQYRYLWSDTVYVGVMAQEVMTLYPEAVICNALDGYLRVNYALLGMKLMTLEDWNLMGGAVSVPRLFRVSDIRASDPLLAS